MPVPTDRAVLEAIGLPVIRGIALQEQAYSEMESSRHAMVAEIGEPLEESSGSN